MRRFDGWASAAIPLVERAIAAHGGLHQWQAITSIRLPFQNGSGFLFRLKGYLGVDGRIVRHDYVADVIGAWAHGAHFWEDYERSGGLLVARRRRLVFRLGRRPTQLSVLSVQFGEPLVGHETMRGGHPMRRV